MGQSLVDNVCNVIMGYFNLTQLTVARICSSDIFAYISVVEKFLCPIRRWMTIRFVPAST